MSELIQIWDSVKLAGTPLPAPFTIPNNPNAQTLKINNQSRYWLYLTKAQTGVDVDRIEPFSFLIMPFQPDLSLRIDTNGTAESSLTPDKEFVDYSTIDGAINYLKGSTLFNGQTRVNVAGSVNVENSQLNVAIQGTPTFNLANNAVQITGTPTMNVSSMPNVFIQGGQLDVNSATIVNDLLPVGQIFAVQKTFSFPAGTTVPITVDVPFLASGTVADMAKGTIFIKPSQSPTFQISNMTGKTVFSDGSIYSVTQNLVLSSPSAGQYDFSGPSTVCNQLTFRIGPTTPLSTSMNVTLYIVIDCTSTAIDTAPGYGVPVQAACNTLNDASDYILSASADQLVLGGSPKTKYFFFQNISTAPMYLNFTGTATVGGIGNVLIPANGGSITFEGNFVPSGDVRVACNTLNAKYTCMWG